MVDTYKGSRSPWGGGNKPTPFAGWTLSPPPSFAGGAFGVAA